MPKSIIVKCPDCGKLLDIDVASGKVVRTFDKKSKGKADPSIFDTSMSKVEERAATAGDRFASAFSAVQERTRNLDKVLEEAKRKALEGEEEEEEEKE